MLTGMLAVRNITLGEKNDLWNVNGEQEYHEEIRDKLDLEPALETVKNTISQTFPKMDRFALGISLGTMTGILLFLLTLVLAFKSGTVLDPNLQLLEHYFPGYSVSLPGSLLGLCYGFVTGFTGGWGFAFLRNVTALLWIVFMQQRAERTHLKQLLEYI